MSRPKKEVPTLRRHKASGRAFVHVSGQTIYMGKWGSRATKEAYGRFIREWAVAGRVPASYREEEQELVTVSELIVAFMKHAKKYYRKNDRSTRTAENFAPALAILRRLYGREPVDRFGPIALKAVREEMVEADMSRRYVNDNVDRIRLMFRFGVENELVPSSTYESLKAVRNLARGRSEARETTPVKPVTDAIIEKTLPFMPPMVQDMVRFQRLTGCRPAEVCEIRPCDIDLSGDVWLYEPWEHKTEHHGRERVVCIGPKAQAILSPYLMDREPEDYCFSPRESEQLRKIDLRRRRKTPVQPSQQNRRKRRPKRFAGVRYDRCSYYRAVVRAVEKAGVEHWSPAMLRHTAATEIRKRYGLEEAQVVLGHSTARITEIYAEKNVALAAEVARAIG